MITKNPNNINIFMDRASYFSSARKSFFYLLNELKFKKNKIILLPSYIGITDREGSGVFDPIEAVGMNYSFYRVDDRLQVVLSDVLEKIEDNHVVAVLLIHYFGFPQKEIVKLKDICRRKDVFLIEDCAHSLYSYFNGIRLGDLGEFSFFSIHKSLPSESGGFLQINNHEFRFSDSICEEDRIEIGALEIFCRAQIEMIVRKRINNYKLLLRLLKGVEKITIMNPALEEGVVPLNMPVLVKEGNREPLYYYLFEQGIPTIALYYRLINEIAKQDFPLSHRISENILNLPIHQDIEAKDLETLAYFIKKYFSMNL